MSGPEMQAGVLHAARRTRDRLGTDRGPGWRCTRARTKPSKPWGCGSSNPGTDTRPSRHLASQCRLEDLGVLMQELPILPVKRVAGCVRIPVLRHRRRLLRRLARLSRSNVQAQTAPPPPDAPTRAENAPAAAAPRPRPPPPLPLSGSSGSSLFAVLYSDSPGVSRSRLAPRRMSPGLVPDLTCLRPGCRPRIT